MNMTKNFSKAQESSKMTIQSSSQLPPLNSGTKKIMYQKTQQYTYKKHRTFQKMIKN